MNKECGSDVSGSENSDECMSNDDEPDDLFMVDHHLEGARRDALIKKGSHIVATLHKKGCVEIGEGSS